MKPINPAYEILSESELPEYRCNGTLFRHLKTGCELYHLASEDEENVFAFTFRTRPRDGTGVAHIVEHSVLCGSERFPVKDSFLVMARRSLATFMNAFTYPDKTVYPAASAVEADYFNLMDVYGDAVFFPRLTEDTFLQEAHRLEIDAEGRLDIKGVVYNEMRGDYSSSESLATTASYTSLFSPGHPYSFDSGGDPEEIPDLDYEGFKAFWASHYQPSNCRIFLYGNIDVGKQLDFLDSHFLSRFGQLAVDSDIPIQAPLVEPRRLEVPYPLAEGADSATSVIVNWLTVPVTDGAEALAMELLSQLLIGHDGAPLAKALRDSGLGEDLSPQCGLDTSFRQIIFSAGLRGTKRGDEAAIESLIVNSVQKAAADGFSAEALDAAMHGIAFANREIRRGMGAYGLRLFNRAARGWLHGAGPETASAQERRAAREAIEPAAARSVHQVDHLDPAKVVQLALEDAPARGPDQARVGKIHEVIVFFLQPAGLEVGNHGSESTLRLAQEHGIGVGPGFLAVQHGADAAEDHGDAARPVLVGDGPRARHLAGEHGRDGDQVGTVVQVERLDVLVAEGQGHVRRHGRGEADRAVRRQVELRLVL